MVALAVLLNWEAGLDVQWCPAALRAHGGVRALGSALGLTISPHLPRWCGFSMLVSLGKPASQKDLGMSAPTALQGNKGKGSWAVLHIPIPSQVT